MENPIASLADVMKIGDRIALKRFCDSEVKSSGKTSGQKAACMQTRRSKLLDRLRNQTEANDETEDAEASRREVQNKNESKSKLGEYTLGGSIMAAKSGPPVVVV